MRLPIPPLGQLNDPYRIWRSQLWQRATNNLKLSGHCFGPLFRVPIERVEWVLNLFEARYSQRKRQSGVFGMQCNGNGLSRWGAFLVVGLVFGLITCVGCEKSKPTVGEQVGDAIDETIKSTGQAASDLQQSTKQSANDFQDKFDQASKNVSKETIDLRDAVKQAVDDHLGTEKSN